MYGRKPQNSQSRACTAFSGPSIVRMKEKTRSWKERIISVSLVLTIGSLHSARMSPSHGPNLEPCHLLLTIVAFGLSFSLEMSNCRCNSDRGPSHLRSDRSLAGRNQGGSRCFGRILGQLLQLFCCFFLQPQHFQVQVKEKKKDERRIIHATLFT